MRTFALACLVVAAACGRLRFDVATDAAGARDDGDIDTPDATVCASTFCDGFDRPDESQPGLGWDRTEGGGSPLIAVTGSQATFTLDATGDALYLVKSLPAPATSVTVSMRVGWTIDNPGTDCEVDLVALRWLSDTCATPFGYYLVRDGTNPFNLQETNGNATCTGNRQNYQSVLDNTGLHDVSMTATLGADGVARIQMVLDGTMVVDRTTVQDVPSAPLELWLGGGIVRNGAGTWTITYDDLVVDVQ